MEEVFNLFYIVPKGELRSEKHVSGHLKEKLAQLSKNKINLFVQN